MPKRKLKTQSEPTHKKVKNIPISPPPSPFPSDVLKWMKKNANPKMAFKLMQICKYFQCQEFLYFVVKCLHGIDPNQWMYQKLSDWRYLNLDLDTVEKPIWIVEELKLFSHNNLLPLLLPKLGVCDIRILELTVKPYYAGMGFHKRSVKSMEITFEQFKILTAAGNVAQMALRNAIIKADGINVPLENILECVPNLKILRLNNTVNSFFSYSNSNYVPKKLQMFEALYVNQTFNIKECFKFIEMNQSIKFTFEPSSGLSASAKKELQSSVDSLIEAWSPKNKPPKILYNPLTAESKEKLLKLEEIYNNKNETV